ncbi:AAA family ATPase [Natronomonas gomsonensis]|uniref:AAA family ATPase n=1 Tax=Natronomonas gomsonensis TaxID=1046043 RepID=UPI0015BEA9DE|nr:AAA family ATPase [Natronomonas gomsonensis]
MDLGVLGLGGGGSEILDSLLRREFSNGTTVLSEVIAIDSAKSGLAEFEYIPESQRVIVGDSKVRGHGTGGDIEIAGDIVRDDEREIASAVSATMLNDVDAYLVVTCAGGGMAGGAPELIDLFHALGTKPVYAAVVLPHADEAGFHQLNAAVNLNNVCRAADGVLLFDNEMFYDESEEELRVEDANEAFSNRILGLFSSVDADSTTGVGTVFPDELNAMLGTEGIATVGHASDSVDVGSQGAVSRFLGGEPDVDTDEATEKLVSLTKSAVSDTDVRVANDRIPYAALLVSGPESYLDRDAVAAAERTLTDAIPSEMAIGTKIASGASTLEVMVVIAGISDAPVLESFEEIYDEAYDGPSTDAPKPPFFVSNRPEDDTGTDNDTGDDDATEPSQPTSDGASPTEEPDAEADVDETPTPPAPDPSDVEGVDRPPKRTFDDVIGLSDVKERIREDVLLPARDERFDEYGIGSVTGVLFHGPPGTGKTYLAKATAGELGYNYIEVDPSDVKSQYVGGGAENVNELFERATEAQPTLMFIDEIDSIASSRSERSGMTQSERSMINELLGELSELNESDDDVIVVAATNALDDVDSAIKRSGRFDTTIRIGAPNFETRYGILRSTLESGPPNELDAIDSDVLRSKTDGLVSSDMAEIGKSSIRKALSAAETGETPLVSADHLLESIEETVEKRQQDSSAASMIEAPPETDFDDVAGMDDLKRELRQTVIDPARNPEKYESYGLNITNGVLLYGPPGTGKTYLSEAVAGELGFNFISITASDVVSKWIGEGTENVNELFETALDNQPSLVFIDEIDAIASQRGGDRMHQDQKQIVNEILTGMSDVQGEDVVVIAATNLLSSLDDALTRSGRFDETIEVPPPDDEARMEMLRYHLTERPLATDEIDWAELRALSATDASGRPYVASDIELIAETAARLALNQGSEITQEHLRRAIEETDASFSAYE